MRCKRVSMTLAAGLLVGLLLVAAAAQEPVDQRMVAAIKAEGLNKSEAPDLFYTLTDRLGQRLTGSPAHMEAARWAVERFQKWGLANPHMEPFEFGRGWSLEKLTIEMVAPRYMPLIGYAEAWSPPTSGILMGTPLYVGDSSADEIDRLGSRLRGAIVLTHRPQTEFLLTDRMQPSEGNGPVRTGNPPFPEPTSTTPSQQMIARLQANATGVALKPGAMEHGTVRVQGNRTTPNGAVPSVVLAAEHYNMLVRMMQAGVQVQLKIEVGARFYENDRNSYNVLAEIPGIDPVLRDEVVLIGAHLDSWHTATGATDNADGVTAVMEAMRILKAVNARPRRTIRVVLWAGEEEGLLGARAYVDRNFRVEHPATNFRYTSTTILAPARPMASTCKETKRPSESSMAGSSRCVSLEYGGTLSKESAARTTYRLMNSVFRLSPSSRISAITTRARDTRMPTSRTP